MEYVLTEPPAYYDDDEIEEAEYEEACVFMRGKRKELFSYFIQPQEEEEE